MRTLILLASLACMPFAALAATSAEQHSAVAQYITDCANKELAREHQELLTAAEQGDAEARSKLGKIALDLFKQCFDTTRQKIAHITEAQSLVLTAQKSLSEAQRSLLETQQRDPELIRALEDDRLKSQP